MGDPPGPVSNDQSEYKHLLSYFKYLVTLTTAVIGFFIAVGTYLFHSSLKDVREDARQEATRVATSEAQARVTQAFEEKNMNNLILAAAQQKVGTITEKMISDQLAARLTPVQQRISFIGAISESEMRMRLGFRAGLDDLKGILKRTSDADVVRFGRSTLATTTQDFETRFQEDLKRSGLKGIQALQSYLFSQHRPQQSVPSNLQGVVQLIHDDSDLNAVAAGFIAFRDLTGENVKMFDFESVTSWCAQNKPKCQVP